MRERERGREGAIWKETERQSKGDIDRVRERLRQRETEGDIHIYREK